MPISRKQFERGTDLVVEEMVSRIHHFLNEHQDEAYTDAELVESLNLNVELKDVNETFQDALKKLCELEMAEKKEIGGISYYAHKDKRITTKRYGF